jgi:hypothetical protein
VQVPRRLDSERTEARREAPGCELAPSSTSSRTTRSSGRSGSPPAKSSSSPAQVAALEQDALVVEHERHRVGDLAFTETSSRAELNIWIRARQDALERLAKYAKMAIDAGVAERHVRVAERYGELLAELVGGILPTSS